MTQPALVTLAQRVRDVHFDMLPAAVVARARALIVDTLACAFAGYDGAPCRAVRALADELGGRPVATIIGSGARTSMPLATLANGTMLRYLDGNDYYFARDPAHPSGQLAVALAVAEGRGRSGRALVAGLVAAYEVQMRLCEVAGEPTLWRRGWHHSTNAQFAAAALAARLMTDDDTAIAHAMAITGSHQNTLAQLQSGAISMIKATAEAWVAKAGVEAAMLAAGGMTGPLDLLEGKAGWIATVAGTTDLDALLSPFGDDWRMLRACTKPYPAVATAMAPIESALRLHPRLRDRLARIDRIDVLLPAYALGTPAASAERRYPANHASADHSFYFAVAASLLDGHYGRLPIDAEQLAQPALRALLSKVSLSEDAALTAGWPQAAGGAVRVTLDDGSCLEERCPLPPGHPGNATPDDTLRETLRNSAARCIGNERAEALLDLVWRIDTCDDVGVIARALGPA